MIFAKLSKSDKGDVMSPSTREYIQVLPYRHILVAICYVIMLALLMQTGIASAQEQPVTDDDVNEIAGKLYCPVCENIPLDTCGTAACADWRYEIRLQLEDGMTEQEVIDDFVLRFGERVVGTPQDPFLRALSLVTPYAVLLLATIITIFTLIRLRNHQPSTIVGSDSQGDESEKNKTDRYRDLLEQDLS